MIQAAFDSHVTVLRFPDGRWGSNNDIQPSELDTFIALCKKIGAIPTISVRFQDSTPAGGRGPGALCEYRAGLPYHLLEYRQRTQLELLDGKKHRPSLLQ